MTQSKREQAIKTLAKYLFDIYGKSGGKVYNKSQRVIWKTEAEMLLKFFKEVTLLESLGYVLKADDQSLPGIVSYKEDIYTCHNLPGEIYASGQRQGWKRMLTPKDGTVWVKVEE